MPEVLLVFLEWNKRDGCSINDKATIIKVTVIIWLC